VKGVRIVKDFAYVLFADRPCVKTALENEVKLRGRAVRFERVAKPEELKQRMTEKTKAHEAKEVKKEKNKQRLVKRFGEIDKKNFPEFLKKARKPRHRALDKAKSK
jgi:hypothetical protein